MAVRDPGISLAAGALVCLCIATGFSQRAHAQRKYPPKTYVVDEFRLRNGAEPSRVHHDAIKRPMACSLFSPWALGAKGTLRNGALQKGVNTASRGSITIPRDRESS